MSVDSTNRNQTTTCSYSTFNYIPLHSTTFPFASTTPGMSALNHLCPTNHCPFHSTLTIYNSHQRDNPTMLPVTTTTRHPTTTTTHCLHHDDHSTTAHNQPPTKTNEDNRPQMKSPAQQRRNTNDQAPPN